MGLPEPRPISQLLASPPSSSRARHSRQSMKGKPTRTKARRLSGAPAGQHRASSGGVSTRIMKTPRTPRTPHSPARVPIRVRGPRLLQPPASGKKLSLSPAGDGQPTSPLADTLKQSSGTQSWDEDDHDSIPASKELGSIRQHTPPRIVERSDTHPYTGSLAPFSSTSQAKASKSQPDHDTQRRATMMNTLFSRLSIDPKSLKRNRKTMAATSQSSSQVVETALPALSFSPITIDIPNIPSLPPQNDAPKLQEIVPASAQLGFPPSEVKGLQRVPSLRSSHPAALPPVSRLPNSRSTPSLPPQLPFPNSTPTDTELHSERKPSHPPSSFGSRPSNHRRNLSSPALGGFTISAPITNASLSVSAEAEEIKLTSSSPHKTQKVVKRPHRRTVSHGSKTLFSPPPPVSTKVPGVPPLPIIPALPPMPAFALEERKRSVAAISGL